MDFLQLITQRGKNAAKDGDYKKIADDIEELDEMIKENISSVLDDPKKRMEDIKVLHNARDRMYNFLND